MLHSFQHPLQILRCNPVIAVNEGNMLTPSYLQSGISCIRKATVGLMDHPHPVILGCVHIADGAAIIRGSVIHQDQFKIGIGLPQQRIHTAAQVMFDLVDRYYDANIRLLTARTAPSFRMLYSK